MNYLEMSNAQRQRELRACLAEYERSKAAGLSLDLSRGNPCKEQLALSLPMLTAVDERSDFACENGKDCRNYGLLEGIPEARRLMGELLGVPAEQVLVGGNSSLTLMYQVLTHAMLNGLLGAKPWCQVPDRKFLCPAPGYDRHFKMAAHFGFELIAIPMGEAGPDMNMVERLVSSDESIKGIWCVPKFQNPTGVVFSQETIRRFAQLKPKAPDFRVFWDNAYCVHSLYPEQDQPLPDLLQACRDAGSPDLVFEFCSTSKITFAGAGISALAASEANLRDLLHTLQYAMIGPDKLNQLRHVRFLRDRAGVQAHMARHAAILRPKFEAVDRVLTQELGGLGIARWTRPQGGYFISFDTMPGLAAQVVALCKEAGVTFTPAGATFPYGRDPQDCNIRLAPSFASMEEILPAARLLALCVRIASLQQLLRAAGIREADFCA